MLYDLVYLVSPINGYIIEDPHFILKNYVYYNLTLSNLLSQVISLSQTFLEILKIAKVKKKTNKKQ